jgi:hypothetical protein
MARFMSRISSDSCPGARLPRRSLPKCKTTNQIKVPSSLDKRSELGHGWSISAEGKPMREPMNSDWSADVRFAKHSGLKQDMV